MYQRQSIKCRLGYQRIYDETTKYASEASVYTAPTSLKGMDLEVSGAGWLV